MAAEPTGGLINVAKRRGPTSHDVVAEVRRALGVKKVGHAGTLDPAAEGVLPILFGPVTRLAAFFTAYPKRYRAEIKLGAETDTGDDEGKILYTRAVPVSAFDALPGVVRSFVGVITQEVPAFAAVKVGGEPLYRKARRGEAVAPPAREVSVYGLEVARVTPPTFALVVECGAGTYVRALARDIGRRLGTGAYVVDLTRLAVGPFLLEDALRQDELAAGVSRVFAAPHFTPADELLPEVPAVDLSPPAAADVAHGREVAAPHWLKPGAAVRLRDSRGRLLGMGIAAGGGRVRPDTVLVSPEEMGSARDE